MRDTASTSVAACATDIAPPVRPKEVEAQIPLSVRNLQLLCKAYAQRIRAAAIDTRFMRPLSTAASGAARPPREPRERDDARPLRRGVAAHAGRHARILGHHLA